MEVVIEDHLCDLCGELDPQWRYLCEEFSIAVITDKGTLIQQNDKDWHLCNSCHELVQSDDIAKLIQRVIDHLPGERSEAYKRMFAGQQVNGFRRYLLSRTPSLLAQELADDPNKEFKI